MKGGTRKALAALLWGFGLLTLSCVPGATDLLPPLLVLRGPMGLVLLALALAVAFVHAGPRGKPAALPGPTLLLTAWAGALLVMGLHYASNLRVSGDEPHYLLMAQSLWREHDLDLRDNFTREDYREYTPGPLSPHYGAPRKDGRPFPAHSPGLPLLLAPIYALGGRRACVALIVLMTAALGREVYVLARRLSPDAPTALLASAAALGPPVCFYAFHVYTEIPSALALAASLELLLGSPGPAGAAAAALLAAALPWLHLKMIPAAAALGALALWRLRGRALAAFLLAASVAAAGFLAYYQAIFGRPTPLALYGGAMPADSAGAPLRAALGLLLDRSFGLLPYAPVFLLALAGLPALLRGSRSAGLAHGLIGAAAIAPVLAWRMWWGGQCPPGRFLVPAVPLLAGCLAARAAESPKGLLRWRWALLGLGFGLALFMSVHPGELLLLNRGDRPTRVWAVLSGAAPVGRYLPSLVSVDPAEGRVALLWAAGLALLIILDRAALVREGIDRLFRGLGLPLLLLLAMGLAVDRWARAGSALPGGDVARPGLVESP